MQVSRSQVSGVVLAAGSARRMNGNKLLLQLGGRPLLCAVVEQAVAGGISEVVVVVDPAKEHLIGEALDLLPARIVTNARAEEGMGSSIAVGVSSVAGGEANAVLLLQGDQPLVDAAMIRALIDLWRAEAPVFVASRYGEVVTTPVLFDRSLWGELRALGGDQGAKAILERHRARGREIEFPPWRGSDIDTPEDYRRVCELAASRG